MYLKHLLLEAFTYSNIETLNKYEFVLFKVSIEHSYMIKQVDLKWGRRVNC